MKILVVSENCGSCNSLKQYLAEKGFIDKYKIVDINSNEGKTLSKKLNLSGVPDCILVDDQSKTVKVCTDQEWHDMLEGK